MLTKKHQADEESLEDHGSELRAASSSTVRPDHDLRQQQQQPEKVV